MIYSMEWNCCQRYSTKRILTRLKVLFLQWFSGTCHLPWTAKPSAAERISLFWFHGAAEVASKESRGGTETQDVDGLSTKGWLCSLCPVNLAMKSMNRESRRCHPVIWNHGFLPHEFSSLRRTAAAETNPREITCFTKWLQEASERGMLAWDRWLVRWLIDWFVDCLVGCLVCWLLWLLLIIELSEVLSLSASDLPG